MLFLLKRSLQLSILFSFVPRINGINYSHTCVFTWFSFQLQIKLSIKKLNQTRGACNQIDASSSPGRFNPQPLHSFLNILKKRQLLSLYWFAAQQHISTIRNQKLDPFYLKFRAELNKFIFRVEKQEEQARKLLKLRCG